MSIELTPGCKMRLGALSDPGEAHRDAGAGRRQETEKGRTFLVVSLQADSLVGIARSQKRRRRPAKRCYLDSQGGKTPLFSRLKRDGEDSWKKNMHSSFQAAMLP